MILRRPGFTPAEVSFEPSWQKLRSITIRVLSNNVAGDDEDKPEYLDDDNVPSKGEESKESGNDQRWNYVPPGEWQSMIHLVYQLCVAKPTPYSQDLYEHLRQLIRTHTEAVFKTLQQRSTKQDSALILKSYVSKWRQFRVGLDYVAHMYEYLGRYWIKKHQATGIIQSYPPEEVHELKTLGLISWRDHVFFPYQEVLLRSLLEEIKDARKAQSASRLAVVKGVLASYIELVGSGRGRTLQIYTDYFEDKYLLATAEHYRAAASEYISRHSVTEYAQKALAWIASEVAQCERYVHTRTVPLVIGKLNTELIKQHNKRLVDEAVSMLQEERLGDLHRVYLLLKRVAGLGPVCSQVYDILRAQGLEAIRSFEESFRKEQASGKTQRKKAEKNKMYVEGMIRTLLQEDYKATALTEAAFDSDPQFVAVRDSALRLVVNSNRKTPEYLAYYCDSVLRKGGPSMTDTEISNTLDNVMRLFKFIDDKDLFLGHYSTKLARRLINDTSASADTEQSFIAYLKLQNGFEYTAKLQRMFTDITANDISEKFRDFCSSGSVDRGGIDFSGRILTQGSWPLSPPASEIHLPASLAKCISVFHQFYEKTYTGRRLTWLHQLSTGTLTAKFTKGKKYEFVVSTHQLVIICLFNEQDQYTVAELMEATGLVMDEFCRALAPIADVKVLKVEGEGVEPSARWATQHLPTAAKITLNTSFTNRRTRIKLATLAQVETPKETEEVHERVEEDRKNQIQACIVRVMKARQTLSHQDLIRETISQLQTRFHPAIPVIKRQIEALIQREYLTRDENASIDTYMYVA